jgi:hypothetical protein
MKLEELHSHQGYPEMAKKRAKEFLHRHPTKGTRDIHQTRAVPTTSAMIAPKKRKPKQDARTS